MIAKSNFLGSNTGSTQRRDGLFFVIWNERYQRKSPVKQDTIFRIYSRDRFYYFCCVMMLVEDGQLQLDKSVGDYIPELRDMPVYGQSKTKIQYV